jgi:subtilisin family serine protease
MKTPQLSLANVSIAVALACNITPALAQAPTTQASPVKAERIIITAAEQLPRRTIKLDKVPSYYLDAPRAEVLALAAPVEANLKADLERYDIKDNATLRSVYGGLLTIAQFKEDWAAVPALVEQIRALQDKAGAKATTGVLSGILSEQRRTQKDSAWVQAEVQKRYGALAWKDVDNDIKNTKSQFELLNPALTRGAFEQQLDVMARNANLTVPEGFIGSILGARIQNEWFVPLKGSIVAGLQAVVDANSKTVAKTDVWTPRQFALAANANASTVNIAVWDSGVDLTLFKPTANRGIAFSADSELSKDLLRPLNEAAPRWPELKQMVKGAMDLRAALDTEDARKLKQTVSNLPAEKSKSFQEDMGLVSLYTHGTHVAGIAVEGNPFARVFAATMLWSHKTEPQKPSEAFSKRTAASYQQTVAAFKKENIRVVNMSWRYGPQAIEGMLTWHNIGANADERKKIARELFSIERNALREAIASAPEILFIAGSGNEDNSADFSEYIPAGFELPNLITAGAVDKAGDETSFSTFGKTVVVHANGFEVDSFLPGGDRVKFSGTSMASPQVANLAAKLIALKPSLTVAQVKEAILKTSDDGQRVRLMNPRKAAQSLGLTVL